MNIILYLYEFLFVLQILNLRAEVRTLQMACAEINDRIDMAEQPSNQYLPPRKFLNTTTAYFLLANE